jgi:hypothetical protein
MHVKIFFKYIYKVLNHTVRLHILFQAKYDFYLLRDLAKWTPNKLYSSIFEITKKIQNFGKFWDFDEKQVFNTRSASSLQP